MCENIFPCSHFSDSDQSDSSKRAERRLIEAESCDDANNKVPMTPESDLVFNVLRHPFKLKLRPRGMADEGFGFPIRKINFGETIHVVIGSQGELTRIDDEGKTISPPSRPFPASVVDGLVFEDKWIGTWLEREFGVARMAALGLSDEWTDGPGRDILRSRQLISTQTNPNGAIWHRTLDSEPIKVGRSSEGIVFCTSSGLYMIDQNANEVWRSQIPSWIEISESGIFDRIISIIETPEGLAILSQAGGFALIDSSDGSILFSKVISFRDKLSDAIYKKDGGWFIMLHGRAIALMENFDADPEFIETPGPVQFSNFVDDEWIWTGWRHDGRKSGENQFSEGRDEIGIAILNDRVLTNDGTWTKFLA